MYKHITNRVNKKVFKYYEHVFVTALAILLQSIV